MENKRCSYTGCAIKVTNDKYCSFHNKPKKDKRLPSHYKGYDHTWRRYRKHYLNKHPLCVRCLEFEITTLATVVDHIEPVTGKDDPMFYVYDNHQALCRECHAWKTRIIDKRGYGVRGGVQK